MLVKMGVKLMQNVIKIRLFYIISVCLKGNIFQWKNLRDISNLTKSFLDPKIQMENYETIQILGEGSFGTVYLIADQKGKKYALKKVHLNPFKVDQALKQIEVMTKLKHPNLITVYESYYDHQQKLEIMMQFCEEGDLLAYFKNKNKNLSVEEILTIFKQIVKAFVAINVKGIIHRDLKPENVLLAKNKIIKIADFGCAREVQFSNIQNLSLDKGTPIYSSPQQLMNQPYSAKCDVWSAGCLLYFIYFGTHPFLDNSVKNTVAKIKKLTEKKTIKLDEETDPTIAKILQLTLIYEDKNRSTWRQLHLSRLFNDKIMDIENYLIYLRSISNIANWITKQFWKNRKSMNISHNKNEIFAYFTIKFQYTNSLMGVQIIKKSPEYLYLFDSAAYQKFDPSTLNISKEIQNDVPPCEKYYKSIKSHMAEKEAYSIIKEKQPQRVNSYSDLDNSIRSGFKILQQILPQLKGSKKDSSANKSMELVWVIMSRWINFEKWFSYEKMPRIEDFINQSYANPAAVIEAEIDKYTHGIFE